MYHEQIKLKEDYQKSCPTLFLTGDGVSLGIIGLPIIFEKHVLCRIIAASECLPYCSHFLGVKTMHVKLFSSK
jgi:hypothetical protein